MSDNENTINPELRSIMKRQSCDASSQPQVPSFKTRQISYEYFTTVPECNFSPGKSVSIEASDTRKQ